MHVSRAVEYGVLGLIALARRPLGTVVMLDEVSRGEDIPKSFLAKIFQSLAKGGLVRSVRGTGGGFVLAKAPATITILDVIQAIEGPIALQRCLDVNAFCSHSETCSLCGLLTVAQNRLKETFSEVTLLDLATNRYQPSHIRPKSSQIPLTLAI